MVDSVQAEHQEDPDFVLKEGFLNGIVPPVNPFPLGSNATANVPLPMHLTKKEQKQKRRKEREKKTKEMRDMIKLGLAKEPPQKLRMSNLGNVLMTDAVADPTRMELEVKKNIEDRLKAHLEANEARKLTKAQKKEKIEQKLKKDAASECKVSIFVVKDLSNKKNRFKVEKNARQLALTGFIFVSLDPAKAPSVIIVEGGAHSIKFYKKLMTRRIKWTFDENGIENNLENSCHHVWEVSISFRSSDFIENVSKGSIEVLANWLLLVVPELLSCCRVAELFCFSLGFPCVLLLFCVTFF